MKKQLLGTTTLVAAGLLVAGGSGQEAYAAEPMSLSVGGYFTSALQVQDEDDGVGESAEGLQDTGISTDGEIQFTATTELDNGLKVRARIEMEAFNNGGGTGIIDEVYLRFSGGFGQLSVGYDDNAAYVMYYQAPLGAYQIGIQTPTFGIPAVGNNAITSYASLYPGLGGDGGKIIYFTPRVNGIQLGLSWQPDGASGPPASPPATLRDDDAGGQEDIFAVGVNFVQSFDEADVAISGGYVHGNLETGGTGDEDRDQFTAGINLSFAGFTVGASYLQDDTGTTGDNDLEGVDVGVTYGSGPWTVGVTYLHVEQERGTGAGEDELDAYLFSGTYNIGPGVNLWAGVKHYDFDDSVGAADSENSATFGIIGTSVSF